MTKLGYGIAQTIKRISRKKLVDSCSSVAPPLHHRPARSQQLNVDRPGVGVEVSLGNPDNELHLLTREEDFLAKGEGRLLQRTAWYPLPGSRSKQCGAAAAGMTAQGGALPPASSA